MRPFKVRLGDDPKKLESGEIENPVGYSGYAVINVPNESERLTKAMELATLGAGLESGDIAQENVDATKKVYEVAKLHIKEISISFDGAEPITDLEDLTYFEEWTALALEIVGVVTSGPKSTTILRP